MKDPIKEYEKQSQRLDEIFGWLSRTFGSNKSQTTPSSFLDAMNRYKDTDTDTDCAKMDVGKNINRKVAGTAGEGNVTIGTNKIGNIKGLRFELLNSNGKGTGKFDNAIPRDFKCYDEQKDIYGIKWLFDNNASYDATSISGDLKAGVKNQSVNFWGKWNGGVFNGHFFGKAEDFAPGSRPGPKAKFSFEGGKAPAAAKPKRNNRKRGPKKPPAPPATGTVNPMTAGTIAPQPAMASVTPAPAGKKSQGRQMRATQENKTKTITMVDFLSEFM